MTREICKACGRVNPVGFTVPDAIWNAATDSFPGVLCVMCFAQRADDAGLAWDEQIEFFPVSLQTHRRADGPSALGNSSVFVLLFPVFSHSSITSFPIRRVASRCFPTSDDEMEAVPVAAPSAQKEIGS